MTRIRCIVGQHFVGWHLNQNLIVRPVPPPQSDIGPFAHNQTEVGGTSGDPEGVAARGGLDRTWNVEDVEEELERKLELLDKNRKALRLEAERHRQEIDRGVNDLHHRIVGLEEGGFGERGGAQALLVQLNHCWFLR